MFTVMYWPLIGGFIALVLVSVLLGWIMDPDRHGDRDRH
jgi:F0F1-type ATP synthase assembly protein I